jgi:RNA polymerase sigma-70 factor, ECF subfamily
LIADAELCRQAMRGVRSALSELTHRWAARVLAICYARVGRRDVAEELAQEALLRALRSLASLENPDCFGAWIRGIADRVALDWLKSPQRTQVPFSTLRTEGSPDFPGSGETGDAVAERNEDLGRLRAEIEQLPEECREALMLFYYHDMTYDELAALLGVSRATVNARLSKARQLLRRRLSTSDIKPTVGQTHRPIAGKAPAVQPSSGEASP